MRTLLPLAVLALASLSAGPALAQASGGNKGVHDWNTNALAKTPPANTNAFAKTPDANTNAFAKTPPANTNAFGTENGGKVTAFGDGKGETTNAFGNKAAAQQLGARYRDGRWYAPAGTDLAPFREHGWL